LAPATYVAALGCGIIASLLFAFSSAVMPALKLLLAPARHAGDQCRQPRDCVMFRNRTRAPTHRTQHADLRHYARAPAPFTSRVMRPLEWEPLSTMVLIGRHTGSDASLDAADRN